MFLRGPLAHFPSFDTGRFSTTWSHIPHFRGPFLVGDGVTGVLQVELPGVEDHRRTSLTNVTSSPLYCLVFFLRAEPKRKKIIWLNFNHCCAELLRCDIRPAARTVCNSFTSLNLLLLNRLKWAGKKIRIFFFFFLQHPGNFNLCSTFHSELLTCLSGAPCCRAAVTERMTAFSGFVCVCV